MARFNQRLGLNRYAADELYRRSLTALSKRDYDRAVSLINEAIEELPRNPVYLATRGLIHLEEAEYDEAEVDFRAALGFNRAEMLANYGMGMVSYRRREFDDALRFFQAAYFVNRARPETLLALGATHYVLGELVQASSFIGQANERFEKLNDKRKAESARWVRELAKHAALRVPSPQQALPLPERPPPNVGAPALPTGRPFPPRPDRPPSSTTE